MSNARGTLVTAGTFIDRDGAIVTGYLVTCTREEIQAVKWLPMYRRVELVPVESTGEREPTDAEYRVEQIREKFAILDRLTVALGEAGTHYVVHSDDYDALKAAIMEGAP